MAVQFNITAIQVSWSAPASGATVTGYVIYYETTGGSEQSVTVGAATTEYTLTGLLEKRNCRISIVALSNHLPSILTGPILVSLGQYNHYVNGILQILFSTALVPSSPTNLASPSQSPTSITLSWEQPAGDAVYRYDIVYTYQGGCSDYTQPENMATLNDGTAREYTLKNLQEFSDYTINVTAVNATGTSAPAVIMITTSATGAIVSVVSQSLLTLNFSSQWYASATDDASTESQQHHCPVGSC